MNERKLADRIAVDIFEAGGEPSKGVDRTVQRIAFKGGTYPGAETTLGGFCQQALADCIHQSLISERVVGYAGILASNLLDGLDE